MNLNWKEHLIGQAYNGVALMRGAYKGFQTIIKKENPRATYVWCWTHQFNRVIKANDYEYLHRFFATFKVYPVVIT